MTLPAVPSVEKAMIICVPAWGTPVAVIVLAVELVQAINRVLPLVTPSVSAIVLENASVVAEPTAASQP